MASRGAGEVAGRVRALLALGSVSGLSDGQLLGRFATGEGLAFEALVERHGPMVLRVCRGVLRDPHDAQDAFQATFLVLVRKAASIRDRESLASWLHGVALRVATHARAAEARRRRLDRARAGRLDRASGYERSEGDDLGARLHEEVDRLPERYRAAVILCYLEGLTCEDAARALRWPVGTVKSRLARARERLRARLDRLGLAPAVAFQGATCPPLSTRLARSTAEAAARFGAGSPAPAASSLAEGALKAMNLAKLKVPASVLLAAACGAGMAAALAPAGPAQDPPKAVDSRKPKADPKAQADPTGPPALVPRDLAARAGHGKALMYALDEKEERIKEPEGRWKEVEVDLRWVAVVGLVDHGLIREWGARDRGVEVSDFEPQYKRLDVERQSREPGGGWSNWTPWDADRNYLILDNLPETDRELAPESVRPGNLVDPLPFLKKGTWDSVNPPGIPLAALEKEEKPRPAIPAPFVVQGPGGAGIPGLAGRPVPAPALLMVRSLDFTVEPGATYRYRVRLVVPNPEFARGGKKLLTGPWSEPTAEVTIPKDLDPRK